MHMEARHSKPKLHRNKPNGSVSASKEQCPGGLIPPRHFHFDVRVLIRDQFNFLPIRIESKSKTLSEHSCSIIIIVTRANFC